MINRHTRMAAAAMALMVATAAGAAVQDPVWEYVSTTMGIKRADGSQALVSYFADTANLKREGTVVRVWVSTLSDRDLQGAYEHNPTWKVIHAQKDISPTLFKLAMEEDARSTGGLTDNAQYVALNCSRDKVDYGEGKWEDIVPGSPVQKIEDMACADMEVRAIPSEP